MQKVDVEKIINEYLNKRPMLFTDLLNEKYSFSSIENFLYSFNLVKNTFANSIPEFADESNEYIVKFNQFIDECLDNYPDENSLSDFVVRNFYSRMALDSSYSNSVKFIFNKSLSNDLERSERAIKQVYSELGLEPLKTYVSLLVNPSNLSSFISSGSKIKQILASKYMLYITDHHSTANCKRDTSSKTLYKEVEQNINETLATITNEKNNYVNYMDNRKTEITEWLTQAQDEYNQFMDEIEDKKNDFFDKFETRKNNLLEAYESELKLSEPADYMLKKAKLYKWKSIGWSAMIIVMIVILIWLFGFILSPKISVVGKVIEITVFSKNIPIPVSIIIIAIISIILYALKIFVKMAISSKHLYEEYHQKHILTYFYLSLINDGKINDSIKDSIILSLFSKSDTGLIKSETNSDLMELMKTIIMKNSN